MHKYYLKFHVLKFITEGEWDYTDIRQGSRNIFNQKNKI